MIAAVVNAAVVILGAVIGLLLGGKIREELMGTLVAGLGISVVVIGITSAVETSNIIIVIVSIVLGTVLGELLRIEDRLDGLGSWIKGRLGKHGGAHFTEGFVTASLLFCVGSMAIMGSFDAGLRGDYQTIFAKSALDGVMAVTFAATMGLGVAFSSLPVLVYQGALTLLASRGAVPLRAGGDGDERRGRYFAHWHGNQYLRALAQADQGGQYAARHGAPGGLVRRGGAFLTVEQFAQFSAGEKSKSFLHFQLLFRRISCIIEDTIFC